MKIRWLASARRTLQAQVEFIARGNPEAARRVRHRVREGVRNLAHFPEAGRSGHVPGTRELIVPGLPYLVVYRVTREAVEILLVLHESRDWQSLAH